MVYPVLDKLQRKKVELSAGTAILNELRNNYNTSPQPSPSTAENAVVIGGGSGNKGAQAMMFRTVSNLSNYFSSDNIYVLSTPEYQPTKDDSPEYRFQVLPWTPAMKSALLSDQNTKNIEYGSQLQYLRNILSDSIFIDISGYALSSQFGLSRSLDYLMNIMIANKFTSPYIVLPQSIGPFNYPIWQKPLFRSLLLTYLDYPEIIYPREESGLKAIKKYRTRDTKHRLDLVLQDTNYDICDIYLDPPEVRTVEIKNEAIGIIPNTELAKRISEPYMNSIYYGITNNLLNNDFDVYIFRHSREDLEICRSIASNFVDTDGVHLLTDDFSSIELEHLLKQFNFVIASRYHSIVHAYKNHTPAIVLGWAEKYHELLKTFSQLDYFFDGRTELAISSIDTAIEDMISNHNKESQLIREEIANIDQNVFDEIKLKQYL